MHRIKNIFFDLDRTLWDFEKNSETALRGMFEEFKLKEQIATFEEFFGKYREINAEYWKAFGEGTINKEQLRNQRFIDTLDHFKMNQNGSGKAMADRYIELSPYQKHLFPGTKEVLTDLSNQGFRLSIITNGFKEVQSLKLKNCEIDYFFDDVLCSEEVGKSKPHPMVFQEALSRANAKPEHSIMIGDDLNADVIGAENVGIRGILFDPNKNYRENPHIEKIDQLSDLSNLVLGIK